MHPLYIDFLVEVATDLFFSRNMILMSGKKYHSNEKENSAHFLDEF